MGVGFSKGCAELAPKNPPPFVPSCLMAICDAAGRGGITCSFPSRVVACTYPWKLCTTPSGR